MRISKKYKYYFFDFFGTVMNRRCSGDDIKRIWSNRMSLFLNHAVSSDILYKLRLASEQRMYRHSKNGEFCYAEVMTEVYDRLIFINNHIDISLKKFVESSTETEIAVEIEQQHLNESLTAIIKQLKQEKKHIYILSDFYFGEEVLKIFLNAQGFGNVFDKILVSCDLSANKASGDIYELILKQGRVNAGESFVIGDDYRNDYINPRKWGIAACIVKRDRHFNGHVNCKNVIKKIGCKSYKNGLSYANYCFVFFKFISALYAKLLREGENRVYFFSREGELLKELFDIYCAELYRKFNMPIIESRYLYVSRQSTYAASLRSLDEERFEVLLAQYPDLSVRTFLVNIGFSDEDIEKMRRICEGNIEQTIKNFQSSREFAALKQIELFQKLYEQTVQSNKSMLTAYLRQNGFLDRETAAVVDVGWHGSIQNNINKCLNGCVQINGYYCGLEEESEDWSENNTKNGLVFTSYPYKSEHYDIWSFDSRFMERILTASHGATRGYRKEEGIIYPLLYGCETENENYKRMAPIQKLLKRQFNALLTTVYSLPVLSSTLEYILAQLHIKCCCQVRRGNMKLQRLMLLGQAENFGYQSVNKERLKYAFSVRNIMEKMKEKLGSGKGTLLKVNLLNYKRFYLFSCILMRMEGKRLKRRVE